MSDAIERSTVKMEIPYFQTPNAIFDSNLELTIYQKIVYIYLCRCCNQGAQAFPSYQTIANKCGMSRRKAIDAVKELIECNLLAKEIRRKDPKIKQHKDMNDTNLYILNDPSAYCAPPQCTTDTTPVHKVLYPSEQGAPKKEPPINKSKKQPLKKPYSEKVDRFNDFEQREYNYDSLEKKLLGWE